MASNERRGGIPRFLRFLFTGLVLGLYTEVLLKLIAGANPSAFAGALLGYPVILTLSFGAGRVIDRVIGSPRGADLIHYALCGIGGLAIEWTFLGNGPGSNAFQLGMFGMWTTFCFGPRVLTRTPRMDAALRRTFWRVFTVVAVALAVTVAALPTPAAKVVVAVLGLSGAYVVWSAWLLWIAHRFHGSVPGVAGASA